MIKLSKIKPNKDNPRVIKDDDFLALVDSIKKFPEMMKLKPIVVDEHWIVQAGNQRLKALLHLNYKDVPDDWILQSKDLTKDQWDEFVIKDNLHAGEWNFEMLKLNYNSELLSDWGIEIVDDSDKNKVIGEIKFSDEIDIENNYVVLKFSKDIDFLNIQTILGLENVYSKRANGKTWSKGIGRVVDGVDAILKIKES